MRKAKTVTKLKLGTSKAAAADRRQLFVQAYLANGHNATRAAEAAGYSSKTAYSLGQRLLKRVEVSGQLARAAKEAADASGLTAQRVLDEIARIAFSDTRRLYRADGTLKRPSEWDDDTAAAVAGVDVTETRLGDGEEQAVSATVRKLRMWDKGVAINAAMRHLGLFERDNAQRGESLQVTVKLM